jgi:putative ABC transport system ATP-binding protein
MTNLSQQGLAPTGSQRGGAPTSTATSDGAAEAAASARGLVKQYGDGSTAVRALDGVDVTFERGRFTAIMGPSGSGKSTLMHCIAGLDTATEGQVWLGSTRLDTLDDTALTLLRRERVGFVFQQFNLLPTLTAEQNIVLPLELAGRRPGRRSGRGAGGRSGRDAAGRQRLQSLAEALGIADRLSHRPSELSGGEQQRVAIARALLPSPDLLVADEPTGNLDSRSGAQILSLLRSSVRELGQTVVMVTHDPTAAAYADRVILLADGSVTGEILEPTAQSVLAQVR